MNRTVCAAGTVLMAALLGVLVPSPTLSGFTPYGACLGAAVLLGAGLLFLLRRGDDPSEARIDPLCLALWCVPAGLVFARLAYCLVRFSFYFYEMGALSVLRVWEGGFLLYGAAAGAMAACALLARRSGVSVAAALDDLAVPGMLVIAIGRLAEYFTTEGVGTWIESEWLMRFPFAVMNEYEEWQLAVFLFEAAAALVILLALLRVKQGKGERMLSALLLYACCQVMLESMRMDGCLKIGFVRISQVISALVILGVTCLRAYRVGGKKLALCRALPIVLCAAAVGGIEWALDKTPVSNILLYAVMIALCAFLMVNGSRFGKKERA